ncbi:MAG: hypothetical protein R3228_16780, partial [Halioglobus sp.]|nr:hypothetical protein [Halioglobus sp.]
IEDVDVSILIGPDPASPGNFNPHDLVIGLQHEGVDVQLTPDGLGRQSAVFDATFDDESPELFPILGDIFGVFQPTGMLSAFDGLDVFGTWTLSILDPFVPGEGANLVAWSLQVQHAPLPGSAALVLLALCGLVAARRDRPALAARQ